MALPLAALTYYRMPDQNPPGTAISDLLDAIFTGLGSATDYRGTALAATHLWTVTRQRPVVVTEAVDCAPPAGTPMTRSPRILFAGRIANAGTMAAPDTSLASALQVGINKLGGAYVDWTAAAPYGSGNWFGYWRAAPTTANAVATVVRCYVSQENILVQIIQAATTHYWIQAGAIASPHTSFADSAGLTAESDDRLYGVMVTGTTGAVPIAWLSALAGSAIYRHQTGNGGPHMGVFQPGTGTIWPVGWKHMHAVVATAAETQDADAVYVGDPILLVDCTTSNVPSGASRGFVRNAHPIGLIQSGRTIRNGSTDLYHAVGADSGGATGGSMLLAAAA